MDRRQFITGLAAATLLPRVALAQDDGAPARGEGIELQLDRDFWSLPRTLRLRRSATGEAAEVCYWRNGALDAEGYAKACYLLRDVKAGETVRMRVALLDLLRAQQGWLDGHGFPATIDILSGYRSPRTNATTEGAARDSAHMKAAAVDYRIAKVPANYLGRLAAFYQGGGVGFYLDRDFVHADVDRVRYWVGK